MEPTGESTGEYWPGVQALLESVFTAEWLDSEASSDHPARSDWEFAKLMQSQKGSLSYPSQRPLLAQQARLMLDLFTWISAIPGSDLDVKREPPPRSH